MAKRPRSEAQRAASRANGRLSRGPKTPEGKRRSRRNALRHGLRARSLDLLLPVASQPAADLVAAVRRRLAPTDALEKEFTDGIAVAFWRLRRARTLEEALLADGTLEHSDIGLAKAFLKRTNAAGTLPLLLRYRSQAVNELSRFLRLLETHRRTPPAAPVPEGHGAAGADAPDGPANDNSPAGEPRPADQTLS